MTHTEIAAHANERRGIYGQSPVTDRDAEIAVRIVGLLLGRPFAHAHAITPARLIADYREECAAADRVDVASKAIPAKPARRRQRKVQPCT